MVISSDFGKAHFLSGITINGSINFESDPVGRFLSGVSNSSGFTFYDALIYNNDLVAEQQVIFSKTGQNSNRPGLTISDEEEAVYIARDGEPTFTKLTSNALLPGLGDGIAFPTGNDDGILISFEDIENRPTSVGFNWGDVYLRSDPCCVEYAFTITLSNGDEEVIRFSSFNNYGGQSKSFTYRKFIYFETDISTIASVKADQLGHNAVLDNLYWGTQAEVPVQPKVINVTFNIVPTTPEKVMEEIYINGSETEEKKSAQELKKFHLENSETISFVGDFVGFTKFLVKGAMKKLLGGATAAFDAVSRLEVAIAEDPPRYSYHKIAEPKLNTPSDDVFGFGNSDAQFREAFNLLDYGNASLEASIITMERLQGAILDGKSFAAKKQAATLEHLYEEADISFEKFAQLFTQGIEEIGNSNTHAGRVLTMASNTLAMRSAFLFNTNLVEESSVSGSWLGESGSDLILASDGNDTVSGKGGDDFLQGKDGDDLLYGNRGNDLIKGSDGSDIILGGNGNDLIEGGAGNDTVFGGVGADLINGGYGDDIMYGGKQSDLILGNGGNDILTGGQGKDFLVGGVGGDTLIGGIGDDKLKGGKGSDIFVFGSLSDIGSDRIIDFKQGVDLIQIAGGSFGDLVLDETAAGDASVSLDGGTIIVLVGVDYTALGVSDFEFI